MQLVINSSRMLCALRLHNVSLLNIRINSKERVIIKNRIGYPKGECYPEYVMKQLFISKTGMPVSPSGRLAGWSLSTHLRGLSRDPL